MTTPEHTIANALLQAQNIVVFTGAGMSADSGIATFRNKPDSHWSQFNPRELASHEGWQANRRRVWAWYEARRANVLAAQPNAGHLAVARLADALSQRTGRAVQVSVVTQNVDNLHERAGSTDVIHLHGSLFAPRCTACHRPGLFAPIIQPECSEGARVSMGESGRCSRSQAAISCQAFCRACSSSSLKYRAKTSRRSVRKMSSGVRMR